VTRYEWVTARKVEGFPVNRACQVAEVSAQSFYDWERKQRSDPTAKEQFDAELVGAMKRIVIEHDQTYGSPRMTAALRDLGYQVNRKRVERLMRQHRVVGIHKPARKITTVPAEHDGKLPDLVQRRFDPGEVDQVWVSDITYIKTGQGWLYLATVLDLGSRRLLGYSMANHMRTELIGDALDMAAACRGGQTRGIVFHSDKGGQYMSDTFAKQIQRFRMKQSVGRTGVCWDNSVAESFFSSLKRELVHRYRFEDRAGARRKIFAWTNRYNNQRLHSSLDYRTPVAYETNQQHAALKAA